MSAYRLSVRRLAGVALFTAALLGFASLSSSRPPARAGEPEAGILTSRPRAAEKPVKPLPTGAEVRTAAGQRRRVALGGGSILYVNEKTRVKRGGDRQLSLAAGEIFVDASAGRGDEAFVIQTPHRELTTRAGRCAVRAGEQGTAVVVASGEVRFGDQKPIVRAGQQLAPNTDRPEPAPCVSHLLAWTRDLMAESESPLVPASQHAGGRLVARDPDGQGEDQLSLRKYRVDVHIEDGFARTTIDQTYFNPTHGRLEGTFYFPLPPDASLSRLAMYVDGRLMEGGMAEREYARRVFEQIVYQQRDPALLEWLDGSTFKMRVFPLEPRQEKRLILSYTQKLPSLYGQWSYRFPTGHSLGAVRDWSFHARVQNGGQFGWHSPSHALSAKREGADLLLDAAERNAKLERDVVLTLGEAAADAEAARFRAAEHEGAKYLMVSYRPSLPGEPERSRRDWVFLFESSGDRDPLLARTQVEVVRGLLANAEPDDTFAMLTANTRVRAGTPQAQPVTPENARSALAFLEKAHLIGALDLGQAFNEAGPYLKAAKQPHLVHVGSGIAAMGERRNDVLAGRIPEGTHYIGIGVGKRWNRALMKSAAERTAGYFTQINPDETLSWRTFELSATLNTPRLLDVSVTDKAGRATFLPLARSLAQGEEIVAVARIDKDVPSAVVIRGKLNARPFEKELAVRGVADKADYLPRTWARLEIECLLAEDARKHRERIIALSKAMYVMTPFTSLLVLESEEMYAQYKVDRGRKDHWALYPCPEKIEVVYEPEDGPPGDPKKGIKPSARQVRNTILVRGEPHVLKEARRLEPDEPTAELAIAKLKEARTPAIRAAAMNYFDFDNGDSGRGAIAPARDFGLPSVTESTAAGEVAFKRIRAHGETLFVGGLGNAQGEGKPVATALQNIQLEPPGLERMALDLSKPSMRGFVTRNLTDLPTDGPASSVAGSAGTFVGMRNKATDWSAALDAISPPKEATPDIQDQVADLSSEQPPRSLLYQRPGYSGEDRLFFDLVAYAPGLNTSAADIRAAIESEAAARKSGKPGVIEDAARRLFEKARPSGWRVYVSHEKGGRAATHVLFDGRGRYAWERTLPIGMREHVVCDGKARLVPWALPRPEDLARGADLRVVAERTVVIVPHDSAEAKNGEGKPRPYMQVRLVFAADGRFAERQLVEMPAGKALFRETYAVDGTIRQIDGDGKELATRAGELWTAKEGANLKPDTRKLVVLPLPYRTREHVLKARGIDKKNYQQLRFEDGLALLAADFAVGSNEAVNVFQGCFAGRDQHQLGLYVLLAAFGPNLDSEHLDVLAHHSHEPLAQYLALHSSPVLRKHASQCAVGSNPWGEGFLQRLAMAHALLQRWQNGRAIGGTEAQRQAERDRALAYVRASKGSAFAWALLGQMQDRAREDEASSRRKPADSFRALAGAWRLFADVPGLAYAACYEEARCLSKSGQPAEARQRFRELYERTLKEDRLPLFDGDFRAALLDSGEWGELLRQTAAKLIARKHRPAVLTLAMQCWQVDDQPLADHLLGLALDDLPDDKERLPMRLAGLSFLWQTGQLARADQMLRTLLADAKTSGQPALWRLAAKLAERRDMPGRRLECLEQALALEHEHLPEVINLRQVREDYASLLGHYQAQAQALVSLKLGEPAGFRAKVIRAADRWRALDRDGAEACNLAARILQTLGERELRWDYLTTPVAERPNEAGPWVDLARTLNRQGELTLADRAYRAAFESEPTNAQILWDRAGNLRQAGQMARARDLYRQLADGDWQPRFRGLQTQARWELEKR
jgi:hypothetical protein